MALLLSFFLIAQVFSASTCDKLSSKEIASLKVNDKNLIACAENSKGIVFDLNVLYGKSGEEKVIFSGDSAFKMYKVYARQKDLYIEEAFNQKYFRPFLLRKWSCENDKCAFKNVKCLWVKSKPDPSVVLKVKEMKIKGMSIPDTLWDLLMVDVMNGSKEALVQFNAIGNTSDAAGSESYSNYQNDLKKLKEAGCI